MEHFEVFENKNSMQKYLEHLEILEYKTCNEYSVLQNVAYGFGPFESIEKLEREANQFWALGYIGNQNCTAKRGTAIWSILKY